VPKDRSQPKQPQINYVSKRSVSNTCGHTNVISGMLRFLVKFHSVMLKLKTGYLIKQCTKSGMKKHFRSSKCHNILP